MRAPARAIRSGAAVTVWCLLVLPCGAAQGPATDAPATELTPEERAFLDAHGPLRVRVGPTGAPLTFLDAEGRLRGIHMDLFALMTVRLGVEFNVTLAETIHEPLEAVDAGEVDVAAPVARSAEREARFAFTDPYYVTPIGFWVSDRNPDARRAEDLDGLRVATTSDAFRSRLASSYPFLDVTLVETPREGVEALSRGDLDALYAGYASVGYQARSLGITNVHTMTDPDQMVEGHLATARDATMIMAILQKGLASIPPEERLQIDFKWAGMSLAPPWVREPPPFYATAWFQVGAASGGVALVLLAIWGVVLRVQVARSTRRLRRSEARLVQQTHDLEAAMAEMESFNRSVSHDLRTPIRSINGFAALLSRGEVTSPQERERFLRVIESESRRMGGIIDALLDLSRASGHHLERRDVNVSGAAEDNLRRLRQADPERNVTTRVATGMRAYADPGQLDVALGNLLGNAWKFTRPRANARIDVVPGDEPGSFVVRDNGVGFDASSPDLFQPFRRYHASSQFEGHGIGLATVYRLVARHGGRVSVESTPGKGTAVTIWLPPAPPTPADASAARAPAPSAGPGATRAGGT